MNHDACHCCDYRKAKCPMGCYRARLTEDLRHRIDLIGIPMTWAHFIGTDECALSDKLDLEK